MKNLIPLLIVKTLLSLVYISFMFPTRFSSALGAFIVRRLAKGSKKETLAVKQVQKVLSVDEKSAQKIVDGMWDNLGRGMGELAHLKRISHHRVLEEKGFEPIYNLIDQGKPFLLMSAHYGNWELIPAYLAQYKNFRPNAVYLSADDGGFTDAICHYRGKYCNELIPVNKVRLKSLIKSTATTTLAIINDRYGPNGVEGNFLGKPCKTPVGPALIAKNLDLPMALVRCVRHDNASFTLECTNIIENNAGKTLEEITQKVNDVYEVWVREHPELWYWMHDRFPDSDVESAQSASDETTAELKAAS